MNFKAVFILFLLANCLHANSQNKLTVASWNIEWFGSTSNGPSDENLQETNVKKVLRYLNADVYGLVEVVDTTRFRRVTDSLGSNYKYVIADFCSGNNTGNGASWLSGQKEAFIYNKTILSNVRVRGLMRNSPTAFANFASGRLPYLLNADVTLNGSTKNFNFIVLHGKAGSTPSDYDRRRDATQELKDTLDAAFTNQNTIIIGDYNDALNQTICTTCSTTISSYDPLIKDSTHYVSISLPLAKAGQTTMLNFPNVIDNHVVSTPAYELYVASSFQIRKDITAVVPDYTNGATSDHYPVTSQYLFGSITTSIPNVSPNILRIKSYPNPFTQQVSISFGKTLVNVQLELIDMQGRILSTEHFSRITEGYILQNTYENISPGIYYLNVITPDQKTILKLVKI